MARGMVNNAHITKKFGTYVTEVTVLADVSLLAVRDPRFSEQESTTNTNTCGLLFFKRLTVTGSQRF